MGITGYLPLDEMISGNKILFPWTRDLGLLSTLRSLLILAIQVWQIKELWIADPYSRQYLYGSVPKKTLQPLLLSQQRLSPKCLHPHLMSNVAIFACSYCADCDWRSVWRLEYFFSMSLILHELTQSTQIIICETCKCILLPSAWAMLPVCGVPGAWWRHIGGNPASGAALRHFQTLQYLRYFYNQM